MLKQRIYRALVWAVWASCSLGLGPKPTRQTSLLAAAQTATTPKAPPAVGTIKGISGTTITLATDSGSEIKITPQGDVKYLRVPPGSKDLKEAVPIQLSDLQPGDRILVRGTPGENAASFLASKVIAMKKADISEKQMH